MDHLEVEKIIGQITGSSHVITQVTRATGGCIAEAWIIATDREDFFLKKSSGEDKALCESEFIGLKELQLCEELTTPTPFGTLAVADGTFLLMDYLKLLPHTANSASELGRAIASMHKICSDKFGFHSNNYIGSTPQLNHKSDNWQEFFVNCRLMPQAYMTGCEEIEVKAEILAKNIHNFFIDYQPFPSLLHGDLWDGNTARISDSPVIFDPAVYYGDRETDIAMTELFGGLPPEFYETYNDEFPLHEDYKKRRPLYQLYHILNHFNMFGGSYQDQAIALLDELIQ